MSRTRELDTGTAVVAALVLLVIVLVAGYVKRLFTTYTITDHRLHIRRGIISRAEQQTLVNRVQNVNTHQSVLRADARHRHVDFDTAAGDDYEFSVRRRRAARTTSSTRSIARSARLTRARPSPR